MSRKMLTTDFNKNGAFRRLVRVFNKINLISINLSVRVIFSHNQNVLCYTNKIFLRLETKKFF